MALLLVTVMASCNTRPQRSVAIKRGFYYWKNDVYSLNDTEQKYIDTLRVQKLYVKFFELERNEALDMVVPVAKTGFHYWKSDKRPDPEIVPVVMIRNEILLHITHSELDTLAGNILFLTEKYYKDRFGSLNTQFAELQMDCDWTVRTKDNYFYLLRKLKQKSGRRLSCTLRLYPYKYPGNMGVPPADRAMLMCYNLVNPLKNADKNSILDISELKKYLSGGKRYPLSLDVALPAYSWIQVYQNNVFAGVIHNEPDSLKSILKPEDHLWYRVLQDTVIGSMYLRAGDRLKYEQVTENDLAQAVSLIRKYVPLKDSATCAFFHLDYNELSFFNEKELDNLYHSFAR
ncbi:hypothetical protein ACTHGU_20345 [Chitinophagaceae bacterium MMS25-I14]